MRLDDPIQILNVGASILPSSEIPIYQSLLESGSGRLHAFDGDRRHTANIISRYGASAKVLPYFLYDGGVHNLYVMGADSGLTSLLEPNGSALSFFNGFAEWGQVLGVESVSTTRLDDIDELPDIDFAKMDVQGAELTVMQHGIRKLAHCVAVQLEVSFVQLYKKQPSFGEVDVWMRCNGYLPHHFVQVKRWSIAPTLFDNDVKKPGNQLLEADIIYIRDPVGWPALSSAQLKKLALLSHYCFASFDLCVKVILQLIQREEISDSAVSQYTDVVNQLPTK